MSDVAVLVIIVLSIALGITFLLMMDKMYDLRLQIQVAKQEALKYKHGYETVTEDKCVCIVNRGLIIDPLCPVHMDLYIKQVMGQL